MTVHNHGSEDGEGLACPETRLPGGQLRGKCMLREGNMAKLISIGHNNPGTDMVPVDPIAKAKRLLVDHIDSDPHGEFPAGQKRVYEVYVVMFAYVLGGWKATMATDMPDGKYYEITYNSARQETYIDEYVKTINVVIQD